MQYYFPALKHIIMNYIEQFCFIKRYAQNYEKYYIWLNHLNIHHHLSNEIAHATFMANLCHLRFNLTVIAIVMLIYWEDKPTKLPKSGILRCLLMGLKLSRNIAAEIAT